MRGKTLAVSIPCVFREREILMWFVIMASLALASLLALAFLVRCFHTFSFVKGLEKKNRLLSWLLACLPLAVLGVFALTFNVTTYIVVVMHLMAAFLLCSLLFRILRRLTGRELSYDLQGGAAFLLTLIYLTLGWVNAHRVAETDYRIVSAKPLARDYRIVEIADSHLGITQNGETFTREMERVQSLRPDMVVLVGDFVDDDSEKADMIAACKALGTLDTPCGVYFVYGNHDEGYYHYRNFTPGELRDELEKNNVTILEDESLLLDDCLVLIGRRDRSDPTRADMQTLTAGLDREKFALVLDHQPNDYAAEAAAGVDLVLSGHTHGGHIFPAGQIGLLMGANDAIYGLEKRGDTAFIVTSGISGWAIPFKTGTFSEIVVIDLVSSTEQEGVSYAN